jgi:hypothetical protein
LNHGVSPVIIKELSKVNLLIGHSYTHYYAILGWDTPEWEKAWGQLIQDVPEIIKEARVPLSGPTDDEDKITPVVVDSEDGIYLNGIRGNAHEPFILRKPGQWTFCKTARKPYDVVVASILLRTWMLAPKNLDLGYVTCYIRRIHSNDI